MTRGEAKKSLLDALATILEKDDDLFPEDLPDTGAAYETWNTAREELVNEFARRATPTKGSAK